MTSLHSRCLTASKLPSSPRTLFVSDTQYESSSIGDASLSGTEADESEVDESEVKEPEADEPEVDESKADEPEEDFAVLGSQELPVNLD